MNQYLIYVRIMRVMRDLLHDTQYSTTLYFIAADLHSLILIRCIVDLLGYIYTSLIIPLIHKLDKCSTAST